MERSAASAIPPDDIGEQGIADVDGAAGLRWPEFGDDSIAVGHQNSLSTGGDPHVLAELVLQRLDAMHAWPHRSYRWPHLSAWGRAWLAVQELHARLHYAH
jgi:hypothetical protein